MLGSTKVQIQLAREVFLNDKINQVPSATDDTTFHFVTNIVLLLPQPQIILEIADNDESGTKHAILAQMQVISELIIMLNLYNILWAG